MLLEKWWQFFVWTLIFKSVWYVRGIRVLLQVMFFNNWKQMAQRLKLLERLLAINNRFVPLKMYSLNSWKFFTFTYFSCTNMAFFTKQDFSSSIFPHPPLSMIVFYSLQSWFLITSAIAYRWSERSLKKLVNAIKVFALICRSPNFNSIQKQGHN